METSSEHIGRKAITRALKAVGVSEMEIRDQNSPGLSIRVRKSSAVWSLRGRLGPRQSTWRVGDVRTLGDADIARNRAHEARNMLQRGVDPGDWLKSQEQGGPVMRHFDPARDGWTWAETVAAFLQHIEKNRSPKTHYDYLKSLTCPDLRAAKWGEKLLKGIVAADIRKLKETIERRGKTSQANHVLRVIKSMMSWSTQQDGSGIADTPSVAIIVKPSEHRSERGRVPTPEELGLIPWRLDSAPVHASGRLALMLTLLTAQRRETIASARQADFTADGERDGWGVWRMESDPRLLMDRPHAVPLPPLSWAVVQAALMIAGRSDWLFPRLRGKGSGDGHMSAEIIRDCLNACKLGLSPHDLRRALATHAPALLAVPDRDIKLILNHAEGRTGDVTARHYAFHESMPAKTEVMKKWEGWVVEMMLQNQPERRDRVAFLPHGTWSKRQDALG